MFNYEKRIDTSKTPLGGPKNTWLKREGWRGRMGYSQALLAVDGIDGWKEYFGEHALIPFFTELLASVGEEKPDDPYEYISRYSRTYRHGAGANVPSPAREAVSEYFDKHGLKIFLAKMLMELGAAEPSNPYTFMQGYISSNGDGEAAADASYGS